MISAFVITGFLGSGKTTLLINSAHKHLKEKKVAIIVNEFGEVGIDGNFLEQTYSQVLEISEGCICCKFAQEFEEGLMEVIEKQKPEIILVETSGASEPFPIYNSVQSLGINVEGVICVIDAAHFDAYKDEEVAKYQIGGTNILVLNKCDLIDEHTKMLRKEQVTQIKEKYNLKNSFTGEPIFHSYVILEASQGVVDRSLFEGIYNVKELTKLQGSIEPPKHRGAHHVTRQLLYLKEGVTFERLEALLVAMPKEIYRIKGVVKLADVPEPLFVNHSFGDTSYLSLEDVPKESLLVCIGKAVTQKLAPIIAEFDDIIKLNRWV